VATPTSLPTPVVDGQTGWLADTSAAWAAINALTGQVGRDGTGSPEGVVTAPVGTVYRDTAVTNGAVLWVKVSGSGNTGWRVAYGDTGWRDISASLGTTDMDPNYVAGLARIRRVGDVVTARWHMKLLSGHGGVPYTTSRALFSLPTGFRPSEYGPYGPAYLQGHYGYAGTPNSLETLETWGVDTGNWASGYEQYGEVSWTTDQALSTLPGSAV